MAKIFISYKYADDNVRSRYYYRNLLTIPPKTTVRDYVDELQRLIGDEHINKGEKDGEDMSVLADSTIQSKLGDKIYDSSITLVLISPNMKNPYLSETEQWIPWEISYSLREQSRNGRTSKTNAVMAIILPDRNNSYSYCIEEHTCPYCNSQTIRTDKLFKILAVNMFNRYNPIYSPCQHHTTGNRPELGECSYIPVVKWDDFVSNIDGYLQRAQNIKEHIADYDIKVNLKDL